MDNVITDELYGILDEMNSQIEDMVNTYQDTSKMDLVIARVGERSREFVDTLEQDMEKFDILETEML